MASTPDNRTSQSLLGKLKQNPLDQQSWSEFVERYGRMILNWCHHWGLSTADAEDVTQNVLVQLASQMRTFEYDRSRHFRAWLKTVAYRAWVDFLEAQRRNQTVGLPQDAWQSLATEEATRSLMGEFERLLDEDALAAAMDQVRLRVQPHTWQAFELTALQLLAPEQVAKELQMTLGAVYVAKSKVIRMIRESLD